MRYSPRIVPHSAARLLDDTSVVWELRGKRTGTVLVCQLTRQRDNSWRLSVTLGANAIHGDTFRVRSHAMTQADFLYADFVREGWTEAFRS